jgi:hypothetical protein
MSTTTVRERVLNYGNYVGNYFYITNRTFAISLTGKQRTVSEGHFWPSRKVKGGDAGGPFLTQRNRLLHAGASGYSDHFNAPGAGESYSGYLLPSYQSSAGASYLAPSSDDELVVVGTKLISLARPVAPLSGFGVTLGELRNDGLPHLVGHNLKEILKNFRSVPKAGSKEYLNWEFGWKPLWSDVMKTIKNVQRSDAIITQLYRDSGKPVRRRIGLPMESETVVTELDDGVGVSIYPPWPAGNFTGYAGVRGVTRKTVTTTRDLWFSGSFTYFIPRDDSILSKSKRFLLEANRVAGLRPDPELLWNLAPWTWLSDWFLNTGDIIANVTSYALDGLVMNYGYQMEHKQERTEFSTRTSFSSGAIFDSSQAWLRESKRRIRATPFGFGLNPSTFTSKQWAILAALGISRGPNKL